MIFRQLFDRESCTFTYLIADSNSLEAILIDPVHELFQRDKQILKELGLKLLYTAETHIHADHVTAGALFRNELHSKTVVAKNAGAPSSDLHVSHKDTIKVGSLSLEVRRTPGHTSGCVSYILEHNGQCYAFTGDALMIRGCGRTDFQEGDASTLYDSVHSQLFSLPDDTRVYPGHNYKGVLCSTIKEEKDHNPRLRLQNTKEIFIDIMENLSLSHPKKIAIAVPANQRCGILEPSLPQRLIDVRSKEEYTQAHLENAELYPLGTLSESAKDWPRSQPLLLICRSGIRAHKAAKLLKELGFTSIEVLEGGMLGQDRPSTCS